MNRSQLKNYAPAARRDFIAAVTNRARTLGITDTTIAGASVQGEVLVIDGRPFPAALAPLRKKLVARINTEGFDQVMQTMAYTWFNRFVAIRYMELHGYLDHGYRVLSHPGSPTSAQATPEILQQANHVELPGLDKNQIVEMQLDGNKDAELYRLLLIAQCNALHNAMPFLFERIDDETELLLPDNLLNTDSMIRQLVNRIDEENWNEIEIIGWLYQFYISERKDQVMGKVVKSADIPAATQLFTPNWIVKYLVQNSIGAQWLATYPESDLKDQMDYYIEPAEQTDEVNQQLAAITPDELNPEELTLIDPACGSGHILVEAYDLFKALYRERGYPRRKIPQLILEKNLYGLDIDTRAAQMAGFALLMKARADSPRALSSGLKLNVYALHDMPATHANEYAAIFLDAALHQNTEQTKGLFSATLPLTEQQKDTAIGYLDNMLAAIPPRFPLKWKGKKPANAIREKMAEVNEYAQIICTLRARCDQLRHRSSTDVFAYLFDRIDPAVCPPDIIKQWFDTLIASRQLVAGKDTDKYWEKLEPLLDNLRATGNAFYSLKAELEKVAAELEQGDRYYQLMMLFEHGCTFGSLIEVPEAIKKNLPTLKDELTTFAERANDTARRCAREVIDNCLIQAELLAKQYDAVVANPPYMGSKGMNSELKLFTASCYQDAKADLFACFIERGFTLAKAKGHNAMVTMHSWMFLSSYQAMREKLLKGNTIKTMAHLGARAFGSISGEVVQTTASIISNSYVERLKPTFIRLTEGGEDEKKENLKNRNLFYCHTIQNDFRKIPGASLAYWANHNTLQLFSKLKSLFDVARPRQGMATTNDDFFLRRWHEVSESNTCRNAVSRNEAKQSEARWFPFLKGGEYRKWYGNNELLVNYKDDGKEVCDFIDNTPGARVGSNGRVINRDLYFKELLTWTLISGSSTGFRYCKNGFVVGHKGPGIHSDSVTLDFLIALLNSKVATYLLRILSPTIGVEVGQLSKLPVLPISYKYTPNSNVLKNDTKKDWDTYETSWDFQASPLVTTNTQLSTIKDCYSYWQEENFNQVIKLQMLEEDNNRLFIDAYGLQDELTPNVPIEQITLTVNPPYRYGAGKTDAEYETLFRTDTMKELVSYAIGCMMGRYSLDKEGLIYAHAGNKAFDASQYTIFAADDDGIIPVTDTDWFADDACNRLVQFIETVWPREKRDENLMFLAEGLGKKASEATVDSLRRYLSRDFFKNHLKTYKKRPIYWLFSSGKQKAFECLVYLHRYNEGTLSKMRMDYVQPLLGKYESRIKLLQDNIASASSTSARKKMEKELTLRQNQQLELRKYDEQLRHYTDQRIALDLDDGVKVNYGKFGTLLANVKDVTGVKK